MLKAFELSLSRHAEPAFYNLALRTRRRARARTQEGIPGTTADTTAADPHNRTQEENAVKTNYGVIVYLVFTCYRLRWWYPFDFAAGMIP